MKKRLLALFCAITMILACFAGCGAKKDEEVKEIYNTPTAHTCTCESEQDFINRYRTEGMWADACLILHLKSIADCQQLFDRWITEYQHNGDTHQSYSDFKKHFIQWARITIQKEKNNGSLQERIYTIP